MFLFPELETKFGAFTPPKTQLLKWVGNKQKFAGEITKYFPTDFNRFFEPFLGSGAIISTVSPKNGIGSDVFSPLMDIWNQLKADPKGLVEWYAQRRDRLEKGGDKVALYEEVKASYNARPNGADFLYLSRTCYGGIIRFRKADGYMSTPCGAHTPMPVVSFEKRVKEWHQRVKDVEFLNIDYQQAFDMAQAGDFIYCDPPYTHSQSILYGAQDFSLLQLLKKIAEAKDRGVRIALSIDGNKRSGNFIYDLPIPAHLFEREIFITLGRSMLKRFQMEGQTLESEIVADRLLLTY
jgi:DNA adenine methylase